MYRLAVLATKG